MQLSAFFKLSREGIEWNRVTWLKHRTGNIPEPRHKRNLVEESNCNATETALMYKSDSENKRQYNINEDYIIY